MTPRDLWRIPKNCYVLTVNTFIASNGFDSLRLKIGWASKRLHEFDAMYVDHCRHNGYTISQRDDSVEGRHVRALEMNPVPIDISLMLSDAFYAIRSGLDHLAWQLAMINNPNPSRDVCFPIFGELKPDTPKKFKKTTDDMPPDAAKIIEELQPYKRGVTYRDDPLWQLGELCNMDKHKIPIGRAVATELYLEPNGWTRTDLDNAVEISWPIAVKDRIVFRPSIPELVFGNSLNSTNSQQIELRRDAIARIYAYVRGTLAPKFTIFFGADPYP